MLDFLLLFLSQNSKAAFGDMLLIAVF